MPENSRLKRVLPSKVGEMIAQRQRFTKESEVQRKSKHSKLEKETERLGLVSIGVKKHVRS